MKLDLKIIDVDAVVDPAGCRFVEFQSSSVADQDLVLSQYVKTHAAPIWDTS